MGKVFAELTTSLDGFVAGPNPTLEQPLGEGGELLHEWLYVLESWRKEHGLEGGETGPDSDFLAETLASVGAVVMGRRMFSSGEGPWEGDPNAGGWWGDDPPFQAPVFVVTHHARDRLEFPGGKSFTFVTDGVESAIEQAKQVAGERDVQIAGGAMVVQGALRAHLVSELYIDVAPVVLGGGTALLEGLTASDVRFEPAQVTESPRVVHLRYAVASD